MEVIEEELSTQQSITLSVKDVKYDNIELCATPYNGNLCTMIQLPCNMSHGCGGLCVSPHETITNELVLDYAKTANIQISPQLLTCRYSDIVPGDTNISTPYKEDGEIKYEQKKLKDLSINVYMTAKLNIKILLFTQIQNDITVLHGYKIAKLNIVDGTVVYTGDEIGMDWLDSYVPAGK
jgi:hypothetical protein